MDKIVGSSPYGQATPVPPTPTPPEMKEEEHG